MKRAEILKKLGIFALNIFEFNSIKVEILKNSPFLFVFHSIAVSSLDVPLYAYRSSADDFSSKSVRPEVLFSLRIRQSYNSDRVFATFTLIYLNS